VNPLWTDNPDEPRDEGTTPAWLAYERFKDQTRAIRDAIRKPQAPQAPIQPVSTADRSGNELRPVTFDQIVGQEKAKALLKRMTEVAVSRGRRMDHILLVGRSGTGKTTFAHVIAHELGRRVFQLEAPISADTLLELSRVMQDGDILFIDEVHQQAIMDRRGRNSSTQPEVLFSVMEDFTLPTGTGVLQFPHVTIMGATTDEGALPDAFINRFPIRPLLAPYSEDDMTIIARRNADQLGLAMGEPVARVFARASRGVPREINNYLKNAAMLTDSHVTRELALEVLHDLVGVTPDGLTADMQGMLVFLLNHARRETAQGVVTYQASVSTIATAIGKSRDAKAIQLRVEPYLIERGYLQVGHGGRFLTNAGVLRAMELSA
jgi:Holliday junction DNA helicase RuvB